MEDQKEERVLREIDLKEADKAASIYARAFLEGSLPFEAGLGWSFETALAVGGFMARESIRQSLCIGAFLKNGGKEEMVAVLMGEDLGNKETSGLEERSKLEGFLETHPEVENLMEITSSMEEENQEFYRDDSEKRKLRLNVMACLPEKQRKGHMGSLLSWGLGSFEQMKGFDWVLVECSSFEAFKLTEKFGFERIWSRKICEWEGTSKEEREALKRIEKFLKEKNGMHQEISLMVLKRTK